MKRCPGCKKIMEIRENLYICNTCNVSYPKELSPSLYTNNLRFFLFTSPRCTYCPAAKDSMKNLGIKFEEIDCERNMDMVNKFNILSVPCLVIEKNGKFVKLLFGG